jgi:NAD(P)H dehydrogenase (quinone)
MKSGDKPMRIAISTPTGKIGSAIIEKLVQQNDHDLILLARNPDKLKNLQTAGVKIIPCDLTNIEDLKNGLQGVDAFHLLVPEQPDRSHIEYCNRVVKIAIEAIKACDVRRVVFNSSYGAHNDKETGPIMGLRNGEIMLSEIGRNVAFIRPCFFMENFLWYLDEIKTSKSIEFPFPGTTSYRFVTTQDIGNITADILTDLTWSGKIVSEIHGVENITFFKALEIISYVVGFEVRFIEITPEQAIQKLISPDSGYTKEFAQEITDAYVAIGSGRLDAEYPINKGITASTTLAQFVKKVLVPALDLKKFIYRG